MIIHSAHVPITINQISDVFGYQGTLLFFSGGPVSEEQFSSNCLSEFSLRMPVEFSQERPAVFPVMLTRERSEFAIMFKVYPFLDQFRTNYVAI